MSEKEARKWLVRTRSGDVLGPFTQQELLDSLHKSLFTSEDEIAPSFGMWISAQNLLHREVEEFTHTHTRKETLSTRTGTPVLSSSERSETFPTPSSTSGRLPSKSHEFDSQTHSESLHVSFPSNVAPPIWLRIAGGVLVLCLLGIVLYLQSLKTSSNGGETSAASPSRKTEEQSVFVKEMLDLVKAGRAKDALKRLSSYHEQSPSEVSYLVPFAALLITEGESPARAKKILSEVLDMNVSVHLQASAHLWLGYQMLSRDEEDMGESHFLECLQLNPKDAAARFDLGRAYLKQERFEQALDYFQLSELEQPNLWLVHIYKGRAKAAMGKVDQARESFLKAIDTAPDRWLTYIYYALFLMGIEDSKSAQATLRRMLTRDPHYEVNTPAPFGFYQEKVNYAEYLNAFLEIMKGAPNTERELGKLYISYLLKGPTSSEANRLVHMGNVESLMAKVMALKVLLDQKAPHKDLRTAVDRLPVNLSDYGYYAYVLRGEGFAKLGEVEGAKEDFKRALLLEPKSAVSRLAYANLLKKLDRLDESDKEIEQLLAYHPQYIPAIVSSRKLSSLLE